MLNKVLNTLFFTIIITLIFLLIPNKSNFPKKYLYIYIPVLVSGIVKYTLGDWDKNYVWSKTDIFYWASIISVSIITILSWEYF